MAALVAQVTASAAPTSATTASNATAGIVGTQVSSDLADSADRLMSQVVRTIHSYQTSSGPALEARVSDPILGDIKVVVSGQAGEIIQAQLVARDRVSADALLNAATRIHASGEGLTGVNVSVRSEAGGTWTSSGRSGDSSAESLSWGSRSGGQAGAGDGSFSKGNEPSTQTAGGNGSGTGSSASGSHGSERAPTAPARPAALATVRRPALGPSKSGGPSLDIRA
jgi:hypothetical protein